MRESNTSRAAALGSYSGGFRCYVISKYQNGFVFIKPNVMEKKHLEGNEEIGILMPARLFYTVC